MSARIQRAHVKKGGDGKVTAGKEKSRKKAEKESKHGIKMITQFLD